MHELCGPAVSSARSTSPAPLQNCLVPLIAEPLSVSVMLEIGRERVYGEGADEILAEAEAQLLEEALT